MRLGTSPRSSGLISSGTAVLRRKQHSFSLLKPAARNTQLKMLLTLERPRKKRRATVLALGGLRRDRIVQAVGSSQRSERVVDTHFWIFFCLLQPGNANAKEVSGSEGEESARKQSCHFRS